MIETLLPTPQGYVSARKISFWTREDEPEKAKPKKTHRAPRDGSDFRLFKELVFAYKGDFTSAAFADHFPVSIASEYLNRMWARGMITNTMKTVATRGRKYRVFRAVKVG